MSKQRAKATTGSGRRAAPSARQKPARKFPVLPVAFVAVAGALVAAVVFSGGESLSDEERIDRAAGTPVVSGTDLAPFRDTGEDPAVGTVAPTVVGEDFDGASVAIEHDGRPKAVLFLAHWCPHCQAEVPRVQEWLEETGGVPGVDIISVSTVYRPAQGNWSPQEWLEDEGWTAPVIRDDVPASVYTSYGAGPFPYWVFLQGDGTVAGRISGETSIAQLEALLTSLESL